MNTPALALARDAGRLSILVIYITNVMSMVAVSLGSLVCAGWPLLRSLRAPDERLGAVAVLLLQALESKVLLDTAMSLYGLEHSELYWEKAQVPLLFPDQFCAPGLPGCCACSAKEQSGCIYKDDNRRMLWHASSGDHAETSSAAASSSSYKAVVIEVVHTA